MKLELVAIALCFSVSNALDTMSNIGYLGNGYDMFRGCPRPTSTPLDPGFASPVFDVTNYTKNRQTADHLYNVPDNSHVLKCQACQLNLKVDISESVDEYRKSLNEMMTWGAGIAIPKRDKDNNEGKSRIARRNRRAGNQGKDDNIAIGIAFSGSDEMHYAYESFKEKKQVYTEGFAACAVYCAELELFDSAGETALSTNFINAVKSLSLDSEESFYSVLTSFGTHFVSSMKMGSLFYQRHIFTEEQWTTMLSESDKDGFSFEANIVVIGGSYKEDNSASQYKFSNASSKSESLIEFSRGAPPGKDVSEWISQSLKAPMPIYTGVQPISSLLNEFYFPTVSNIDAKRDMWEKLIEDGSYCNHQMKISGKDGDCSAYFSSSR